MYIQPNTNIYILRNVPLDPTYDHTIWWNNVSQQIAYFTSMAKYKLTAQSYSRVQRGRLRVGIVAESLYDCNYVMFQNAAFGNKWFYAFIKGVEYYNNGMSEITFEIDVMQTWFFDYQLDQCFVEREHSETDNIGDNTVPENLETGPYVTTAESNLKVTDLGLYIMVTELIDSVKVYPWNEPGNVGGFPMSCYWISLSKLTETSYIIVKGIVDAYTQAGKADAIVAIFTCPYNMVSTQSGVRTQTLTGAERTLTAVPRNSKLFTYPYCALVATALGQSETLRYELFSGSPSFSVRGGFGPNMQVMCNPKNYAGLSENLEHTLTIKEFPICGWVSDYYQNWLAQNKASISMSNTGAVASTAMGMLGNFLQGNVFGAANTLVGGLTQIGNTMAKMEDQKVVPDQMAGSANAGDIMAVSGLSGFYTKCKAIRPEYLRIIDDYFTMFGYATHRVKVPNRSSRPRWNYVKTIGCVLNGSIPADDIKAICEVYNNGITFWKNPEEIGDYTLFNGASGVG